MNKNFKTIISRGLIIAMLVGGTGTILTGCGSDGNGIKVGMMSRNHADDKARAIMNDVYGSSNYVYQHLEHQTIFKVCLPEEDLLNLTPEQLNLWGLEQQIKQMYLDNGHDIDCTIYIYDFAGKVKLFEAAEPTEEPTEPTEDTTKQDSDRSVEEIAADAYKQAQDAVEKDTKPAKKETTKKESTNEEDEPGFIKDGTHLGEELKRQEELENAYNEGYIDGAYDGYTDDGYTEPESQPEPNPEPQPEYGESTNVQ